MRRTHRARQRRSPADAPRWLRPLGVMGLAALVLSAVLPAAPAVAGGDRPGHHTHYGENGESDVNVCSDVVAVWQARCFARVRTDSHGRGATPAPPGHAASAATLGNNGAYDPSYLQSAYNAPSATAGVGQTVAVVDAYDDPRAESDLAYYRSFFGLPACTTANGCFRKVNQNGGTSYPRGNAGWGQEISLDLDMVSALCPNCSIVLVEASTNSLSDLGTAVNTAVALHANAVTNSYGGGEYASETADSTAYYDHPGVAITVSSGDSGYGVQFPAASPTVTAVGGTSLIQNTNTGTRNGSETAWSGAGSGCSAYEGKPSWQTDPLCPQRTVADVSAVADPNTGVWVYDTYQSSGWAIFGGTSVASPLVAAVYALAGNTLGASAQLASYPYAQPSALNDVVSGSNGSCGGSYLCTAQPGYDGPTGLGTPNNTPAFGPSAPPPPPTSVPSAPQNLTAAAGDAKVALSWSPPTSGGTSLTYNVYRGLSSASQTLIASGVATTGYTDGSLTNGTTYYYTVTAVNSVGEGPASNVASATPVAAPTIPGAPQNLTAATSTTKGVALAWNPPSSDGGSAITGYEVYRSNSSGTETAYVSVTCTTTTCSYNDSHTRRGKIYYYEVAAINAVGTGPRSNQASATAR